MWNQRQLFETLNVTMGSVDDIWFLFKRFNNSFKVAVKTIWPWQKQNKDFQFLAFPIGHIGGLTVESEDSLHFLRAYLFKRSSGTRFDHGQFEIKALRIYTAP